MREGLRAYALDQAALQRSLAASFKLLWTTPLADVDDVLQSLDFPGYDTDDDSSDEGDEDGADDADTDYGDSDNNAAYGNDD